MPNSLIRYTLDGSEPKLHHGSIYAGPVAIAPAAGGGASGTRTVRAAAFAPAAAPGGASTHSYLFITGTPGGGDSSDYEYTNSADAAKSGSANWQAVWSEIKTAAASNNYELARQWIDLENLADYMLLNFYAGNPWDWNPNQNWMAGGPKQPGRGGWKFFCWDADIILQDVTSNATTRNVPDGLFAMLMQKHEAFRVLFRDRVYQHCFNGGALTGPRALAAYNTGRAEIMDSIIAETARWQPPAAALAQPPWDRNGEWEAEYQHYVNTWFPQRTDILIAQLRECGWYPNDPPEFSHPGGTTEQPVLLAISNPNAGGAIHYTLDGSDPYTSAGALVYADAIPINEPCSVAARVRDENGGITKQGSGKAALTGAGKLFAGPLVIERGVLQITGNATPAASSAVAVQRGGQLRLVSDGAPLYQFGGPISLRGDGRGDEIPDSEGMGKLGALRYDPRSSSGNHATLANALAFPESATIHVAGSNNRLDLTGTLDGPGGFRKSGGGILGLADDHSAFTAQILVDNGTLRLRGTLGSPLTLAAPGVLDAVGACTSIGGNGLLKIDRARLTCPAVSGVAMAFMISGESPDNALLVADSVTALSGLSLFLDLPLAPTAATRVQGGLLLPAAAPWSAILNHPALKILTPDSAGSHSFEGRN